jgi:molybdenum cofactor biosynthesis enzyme
MNTRKRFKKTSTRDLSHVAPGGQARMVNVSGKSQTLRTAIAEAWIFVGPQIAVLRETGGVRKGGVRMPGRRHYGR